MNIIPIFFLTLLFCPAFVTAQSGTIPISTEEELGADIKTAPCKGRNERLEAVRKLFVAKGAAEGDVETRRSKGTENVVVSKKGTGSGTVIIGAHYDKEGAGCGVIDNWTGVAIVLNLYRSVKDHPTEKTYQFVAFDLEESGLVGSKAFADLIPKENRAEYCAMLNFDSFGFSYPQVLANVSNPLLAGLAADVSEKLKIPFSSVGIDVASADSRPFNEKGIPAATLHGLSNNWPEFLHGSRDRADNVNIQSVYLGYRHALAMLMTIDGKPCEAFRKKDKDDKKGK